MTLEEFLRGALLDEPYTDNSRAAQAEAADRLEARDCYVAWEVRVPDRGDGRPGRVDLVAHHADYGWFALEIDRKTPRRKSARKLRSLPSPGFVLLRVGPRLVKVDG